MLIRLRILSVIIFLSFAALWVRLFYWQIISHKRLTTVADNQHFFQLEILPRRGEILASDRSILVSNQTAYLVFAEKKYITDEAVFARLVSTVLEEDEASVSAKLTTSEPWVPLKHYVEEETVGKLKELSFSGLGFEREDKRYYPESSMSAHLLGFVGKNEEGEPQGYFGVEGYYDKELRGISGFLREERDAVGNPILIGKTERVQPKNGRTLVLHLDKAVQFIAQERLKVAIDRYGAKAGSVIILDPKTGGIIASSSFPSYFEGEYDQYPSEYYKNPVVSDSYEPGSTYKPLVMAKAIDNQSVKVTDNFDERGPVHIGTYAIKTWNGEYHGQISMTQILEYSSNVGMVYIADKLGHESFFDLFEDMGIGEKTGVDVEDEEVAALRLEDEWRDIDYATASFGQGIAVTPLQMVMALSSLANGGWRMEPHVVKEIVDSDGKTIEISPKRITQLFSKSTSEMVSEMMVSSVLHGEAKWKVPKGFRIAGKTGTAQIPVQGHYDEEKTIASFVGFGPVEEPKFVMLVTLREPTTSPWGSETAAPLFFEIATELFRYYGMTPR